MSYYAFLELVERAGQWISPITAWSGVSLNGTHLVVDTTIKDKGGDYNYLLQTFLGPLVDNSFEIIHTHEVAGRQIIKIKPIFVSPDWDRKYGDST